MWPSSYLPTFDLFEDVFDNCLLSRIILCPLCLSYNFIFYSLHFRFPFTLQLTTHLFWPYRLAVFPWGDSSLTVRVR
jgi:hypothetical protein